VEIQCPRCGTIGEIYDKLVPDEGRYVWCHKCTNRYFVKRPTGTDAVSIGKASELSTKTERECSNKVCSHIDKYPPNAKYCNLCGGKLIAESRTAGEEGPSGKKQVGFFSSKKKSKKKKKKSKEERVAENSSASKPIPLSDTAPVFTHPPTVSISELNRLLPDDLKLKEGVSAKWISKKRLLLLSLLISIVLATFLVLFIKTDLFRPPDPEIPTGMVFMHDPFDPARKPYMGLCDCGEANKDKCLCARDYSQLMVKILKETQSTGGIEVVGGRRAIEMPEDFWMAYCCLKECTEQFLEAEADETKDREHEEWTVLLANALAEHTMGCWYYYVGDFETAAMYLALSCEYGDKFDIKEGCELLEKAQRYVGS